MVVRRSIAEAPVDINVTTNSSFVLAADRTYRTDPLRGFRKYTGGWNISEVHYWASVGSTAFPLFIIALAWFVVFFLVMLVICCHHCCCPHQSYTYSRTAYALSLILLILFTCAAIAGCIMLYDGQGKFHTSTTTTLKFVVSQAIFTVDNLRNLSDSLSAAKKVDIGQFLLPSDMQNQINEIQGKLNSSATELATKTTDNSEKIQKTLNQVRFALIIVAAVMLLLAFIGFLLSIFGLEFLVSVLVVIGWILVTGTFILCGVFLILHKLWGAQTQRSLQNFDIGGERERMSVPIIRASGVLKKCAAKVNMESGLDPTIGKAIMQAAREVADGQLDDHFPFVSKQWGFKSSFFAAPEYWWNIYHRRITVCSCKQLYTSEGYGSFVSNCVNKLQELQADIDLRGHDDFLSEYGGIMDFEEDRIRPKRFLTELILSRITEECCRQF